MLKQIAAAQADALEIEAAAKRRLADEYDTAQERGEVTGPADRHSSSRAELKKATASDIGLSRKDIHEARTIRDAERADPDVGRHRGKCIKLRAFVQGSTVQQQRHDR